MDISSSSSFLLRLLPFLAGALIASFQSSPFLVMLYFYIPFLLFLDAIRTANLSFYLLIFFGSGQLPPHALPSSTKERLVRRYAKVVNDNFVTRSLQAFFLQLLFKTLPCPL
jgi:hypothetical protein